MLYWASDNSDIDTTNKIYDNVKDGVIAVQGETFISDYTTYKIAQIRCRNCKLN